MKTSSPILELQREAAWAIRTADAGELVAGAWNDRAAVHVISAERLGGIFESLELAAD